MKVITSIRLPNPSVDRLREEAVHSGLKPAEIIRRAVDEHLDRREAIRRERLQEVAESTVR